MEPQPQHRQHVLVTYHEDGYPRPRHLEGTLVRETEDELTVRLEPLGRQPAKEITLKRRLVDKIERTVGGGARP